MGPGTELASNCFGVDSGGDAAARRSRGYGPEGRTAAPIAALAHLQLGRAYAMQGDAAKAKAAYQDFFVLWKDADHEIPVLKQSKAEYAKLQ